MMSSLKKIPGAVRDENKGDPQDVSKCRLKRVMLMQNLKEEQESAEVSGEGGSSLSPGNTPQGPGGGRILKGGSRQLEIDVNQQH